MSDTADRPSHYSGFSRTIHWLTAILIAAMLYTGFTGGPPPGGRGPGGPFGPGAAMQMGAPPGQPGPGMRAPQKPFSRMPLHKAMGTTILLLAVARLGYRLVRRVPALPADTPPAQAALAHVVQGLLYVILLAQPITGIMSSSKPYSVFGLFTVPPWAWVGPDYSKSTHWIHQHIPWLLIALIALHASGALFHHYVLKDNVLRSMVRAV